MAMSFLLAVAIVVLAPAASALAQSTPRPGPNAPGATQGLTDSDQDDDSEAAILLDEAKEEIELGELKAARRRLEIILIEHASSSVAAEARALLEKLAMIDNLPVPPAPPASARKPPAVGPVPPASGPPARQSMRMFDEDFKLVGGDRIFFADGSADIGARGRVVLREKAAWLKRHSQLKVLVEAHAHDSGGTALNAQLAERRADAVRQRLVEEGVDLARVRTETPGLRRPVATCSLPACAAQNRRVVLVLTDREGERIGPVFPDNAVPSGAARPRQ